MNKTRTLGEITIAGVTFHKGDNGRLLFYNTQNNDHHWVVFSPHGAPRPYWAGMITDPQGNVLLNLCTSIRHLDGHEDKDILHDLWASEDNYQDPPLPLLKAIAAIIQSGIDPRKLDRMPEAEQRAFLAELGITFSAQTGDQSPRCRCTRR